MISYFEEPIYALPINQIYQADPCGINGSFCCFLLMVASPHVGDNVQDVFELIFGEF